MSSEDVNKLIETVEDVITEKKRNGLWGPHSWQTTLALIAALRLPDTSVANYLQYQGAELSTRSLLSVVQKGSAKLLCFVIKELQKAGKWWPEDWYTGLALAETWFYERKKLYTVFSENDVVFMPEWLVTAVKYGDIGLIVKIIHGLKSTGRWDPCDRFISQAIAEAIKQEVNIWYYCLLQEGALPDFQHLEIAVNRGDCNVLADVIQNLKKQGVWADISLNKDVLIALEEACIKSDTTSYRVLVDEGAEPSFHCLLTVVKTEFYQLATRITRDLKHCGKWNEKSVRNDWSMALARDRIQTMPDGIRQKWENLLFDSCQLGQDDTAITDEVHIGTVTDDSGISHRPQTYEATNKEYTIVAPPNTPKRNSFVLPIGEITRLLAHEEEREWDETDRDMYEYDEPTDETLYRSLQRSVSAPVATNDYESFSGEMVKLQRPARKRHSTGPVQRQPSDPILLAPRIESNDDIVNNLVQENGIDLAVYTNPDGKITPVEEYSLEMLNKKDGSHTVKPDDTFYTFKNNMSYENRAHQINAPCRTPRSSNVYLDGSSVYCRNSSARLRGRLAFNSLADPEIHAPSIHSRNSSARICGRSAFSKSPADPEMQRLRRQFCFSIQSIPLTSGYRDHLHLISSLRF